MPDFTCGDYVYLKDYGIFKTRYWIISSVYVLCFRFRSKFPIFTLDPVHYTPKSLRSFPNGLIFTPKS